MPLSKIDSDSLNTPITAADLAYTGTLTGSTGIVNIGSGQVYKDASGNVGIGTASPSAKLHVVSSGNPALFESTAANKKLLVQETTDSNANGGISIDKKHSTLHPANYWYGDIAFRGWDGSAFITGALIEAVAQGTPSASNMPGNLRFSTNSGGSGVTERARIDSNGNFFINATSFPAVGTERFGVQGNTGIAAAFTTNSASAPTGFFSNISTGTVNLVRFSSGPSGTTVGNITGNGTNAAYNTSSDYRLKNSIAPMTGALAKVALLKPCTYKWNVDGSDGQGFIAHELQEVVEGCVTGEKDAVDAEGNPQYQGIDTSFLVATLTAAIQELKAIVDGQAVLIAAQGAEIAALKGTP